MTARSFCNFPVAFPFGVVVAHIYLPVTGKLQTLILLNDPTASDTFNCNDYFVIRRIQTCLGVSNVLVDFFELFSTEFAACSKPPSRDNHRKASYPRTQQRDQGVG